jgi:hypothetical protein
MWEKSRGGSSPLLGTITRGLPLADSSRFATSSLGLVFALPGGKLGSLQSPFVAGARAVATEAPEQGQLPKAKPDSTAEKQQKLQ